MITKQEITTIDGEKVFHYTLQNKNGNYIKVTNLGCTITSIVIKDKEAKETDIVLGGDDVFYYLSDEYKALNPYFGCIVGRYANRIAKGKFSIDDKEYNLVINNGENALHGGFKGFDKMVWNVKEIECGLEFSYFSIDDEEGYPGNLTVKATYTFDDNNVLTINYFATSDKTTPINLTNHSYFNLSGESSGDIREQLITINADQYTPVDNSLMPNRISDVEGTVFDLRKQKAIGKDFDKLPMGYDHNFIINRKSENELTKGAVAYSEITGIELEVSTTKPGVQFYTAYFLDGSINAKKRGKYKSLNGFCLEDQNFPNSPNTPNFPNSLLYPNQIYQHKTTYKFSIK